MLDTLRLRWKGLLWEGDSTKLLYVRARWYDPVTHRFLTQDPSGLGGGITPYVFAANDPLNMSDPDGLRSTCFSKVSDVSTVSNELTFTERTVTFACQNIPDGEDEVYPQGTRTIRPGGGERTIGASRGPMPRDVDEKSTPGLQCALDALSCGAQLASDVAFFSGVGMALKAGEVGGMALARLWVTDYVGTALDESGGVYKELGLSGLERRGRPRTAVAARQAFLKGSRRNGFMAIFGSSDFLYSCVPILGSIETFAHARNSCRAAF